MIQKTNSITSNFSSGEVSPKLRARLDLAQYQNSCRTIQNGIVTPQGGIDKCPGTYFVNEINANKPAYLFPFKYSADEQYMMEIGDQYIRFYYNHALLANASVITPYKAADIPNLSMIQSGDVVYFAHNNYPPAKLSRHATGFVYEIIQFQTGDNPIIGAGAGTAGCVRIVCPNHGLASNNTVLISGVQGVPQANGIFVINVIDVNTFDLIGSQLPGFQIVNVVAYNNQLILIYAPGLAPPLIQTGDLVNIGGVQGAVEANGTWPVTEIDQPGGFFNYTLTGSNFVNNYIGGGWVSLASAYGYLSGGGVTLLRPITAITNNGSGEVRITSPGHGFETGQGVQMQGTGADGIWEITVIDDSNYDLNGSVFAGSYSVAGFAIPLTFATPNNYPAVVSFFEQRLVWGSTLNQKSTLWLSVTGDFENLVNGPNADAAMVYSLILDGINAIRWMASWNVLLLGTEDGEWRFGGATTTEPVTPNSVLAKVQSKKGSANIKALLIGDFVIYIQFFGKKIYQIGYEYVKDTFSSSELTKLAAHITSPGIVSMAAQEDPDVIVWFCRADGVLASMTFYTEEKIIAFSRRITQGSYEWCAGMRGPTEDEIWVVVTRTINGQQRRFIEYFMTRDFVEGTNTKTITKSINGVQQDFTVPVRPYPCFFVDSGLTFDGGDPVSVIGATQANPVVISYSGTDPVNGASVMIENVQGMTDLNENTYTVSNVNIGNKTFQLYETDGTAFGQYVSGGTWKSVVQSVSGLDHLDGEQVDIYADGFALAPQVVVNGGLQLGGFYNRVSAGLHYEMIVEPQSIEINTPYGTSAGIQKRIEKLMIRLYNTIGLKAGKSQYELDELIIKPREDGMFTGDAPLEFKGDYDSDACITLVHDQPLPCSILGIITLLSAGER